MPILLIIVFVAVVIVGFIIFKKITNRSKKCPFCGEKYDSSCIQKYRQHGQPHKGVTEYFTDVDVVLLCKKCGKENKTQVTLKTPVGVELTEDELYYHFDK